ncbi:MAG: GNAT family N-acetyltransferase [Alphaproteobacteria bacterium]|nr:GNAT family N-acetyltransferase [Alphaproteobacteria bacterium]
MRASAVPARAAPSFRDRPRSDDVAAIRRIVESTGFFRPDEVAVAVELVEERLARGIEASGYHFVFADDDEGAVGYACFGPIPCSLVSWDLYWIAVEDAARGRGLGRELLGRAEAAMRAQGGRAIYIETSSKPQYDATRAFYLACGYRLEHVFADFYAPGDGKAVYSKRL